MRRVLLKLSGEALAGDQKKGFDEPTVTAVAKQVKCLSDEGFQIGIVIGGGNFWRGCSSENINRCKADQIGMLATVMTPFACGGFTNLYSLDRAMEDLGSQVITFFAGGTGHPYFSTDTATVLRAIEIEADEILLAKSVDGVYDSDPQDDPNARKYDEVSIQEVIDKNLKVVDMTASILCRDNKMPMLVFSLNEENSIVNAANGKISGTRVTV